MDALTDLVSWSTVGVTALWQVRRWSKYRVHTATELERWIFRYGHDWATIEARAPYKAGHFQRSWDCEMSGPESASWIKHAACLPRETVMALRAAGITPRDVVPFLHAVASEKAWMGYRWGKNTDGRSDGCGPLGASEYTGTAFVALASNPGLSARVAVAAARAGFTATEISALHVNGSLDGASVESLRMLRALRQPA